MFSVFDMKQPPIWTITKVFWISKVLQYTIIFFTPCIESQFDTSTTLLLDNFPQLDQSQWYNAKILNKLLSWDSAYYLKNILHMAQTPDGIYLPEYENEYAFSPFVWSSVLRFSVKALLLKEDTPFLLLVLISITNIIHYCSTIALFYLTRIVFEKNSLYKYQKQTVFRIAMFTCLLFIFSLSGGFQSTFYSEQFSTLFTFLGMYTREYSTKYTGSSTITIENKALYLLTSVFFTVAAVNRPNCVINGLFFLLDLQKFIFNKTSQHSELKNTLNDHRKREALYPLVSGCFMLCGMVYTVYYTPFQIFCNISNSADNLPNWCNNSLLSQLELLNLNSLVPTFVTRNSLYTYIQTRYWNVGFLTYYTANNIPNVLIALPNVIYLFMAANYFQWDFNSFNLHSYCYVSFAFLIMICGWAHLQIINRVITFIPLHLWYLSSCFAKNGNSLKVKLYLAWVIIWWPLQTVLFANFLPPA